MVVNSHLQFFSYNNSCLPAKNTEENHCAFQGMEEDESNDSFGFKSPSAIDFYDYGELSDELEEFSTESPSKAEKSDDETEKNEKPVSPPVVLETMGSVASDEYVNDSDKPLALVLPPKLRDVKVQDICPAFREGKVLKVSALFGIGKPSNLPDIWRSVRKRSKEIAAQVEQKECEVELDEEIKFLSHKERTPSGSSQASSVSFGEPENLWRYGPAQLWYDATDVPLTAETYDYGMKVKDPNDESSDVNDDMPPDSYLMVTQTAWEDNVIWDGDSVKDEVMKDIYSMRKSCAWVPINMDRTFSSYIEKCKYNKISENTSSIVSFTRMSKNSEIEMKFQVEPMFPEENLDLLNDKWEDDVIWDVDAMPRITGPKNYVVDDSDIIRTIPDDVPPNPDISEPVKDRKERKIRPFRKTEEEPEEDSSLISAKQDFFNISNDEYYNPKMTQETALKLNHGCFIIQHSTPAVELRRPYFPTFINEVKLRRFHRPLLRQYARGPLSRVAFHGVNCLTSHIRRRKKERQQEREESGGGNMFFMRTPGDLSGSDGDLVLFEFSEEHPPLMMQVGMASKIWNYYKRRPGTENTMPDYKYGEISLCQTSPFLGKLQPGQSLQAYENNLFRAPIYEHSLPSTDFLIIRHKNGLFIRNIETIFTVGQQLPLVEVPSPKSEKASKFLHDFLLTYVYRAFKNSDEKPPKIKTETIQKAFPQVKTTLLSKVLKSCSDYQRSADGRWRILKKIEGEKDFRLPEEDEIRKLVTPEQCCAYYSMLSAEQRLKDAGYGDKFLLESENDLQNKIDDEVKAAPWNTTQAFISAIEGKCFLDLSGVADPTGCGEGFSYVKAPHKPQFSREDNSVLNPKRTVRGTDADLRRLSMANAKKLLKEFNVPDKEIKRLSRWEIIDMVRTLSTERAKSGEEGSKFARGNLHGQAEYNRRYKEECQRLFDLQNKVLASTEVLSTDEDSSSEDSDLEEGGKKLEDMLTNKKTAKELSREAEEAGRKELQMLMSSNAPPEDLQKNKKVDGPNYEGKILKIYRTYQDLSGKSFTRVETVRKSDIIELYVKINETKGKEFIRDYVIDEEKREEMRKERRRLQDQLRRLNKNEMKILNKDGSKRKSKFETPKEALKVKCGACGGTGHMRTNKACPMFQSSPTLPPIQVAMTDEQIEEAEEFQEVSDLNLVKVDETKIAIPKNLLNKYNEARRKSLVLKIPKDVVSGSFRKKRSFDDSMSDYVYTPKTVKRKRVDPLVSINLLFESLIKYLKTLPESQAFWYPVTEKEAPGYLSIIDTPMSLLTMRDKALHHKYKSREDFAQDIQQIVDNSTLYNGVKNIFTTSANALLERCFEKFKEDEEKYMELEKTINPLLDNDQVAFSYMLERIITEHLKTVPESWPFHKPVDKRNAKNYYECIKYPMDLETLVKNCKANKYRTVRTFLADVELIFTNSETFNGKESHFTKIAQSIVQACGTALEMYGEQLRNYESGIEKLDSQDNDSHSIPAKVQINHSVKKQIAERHNGLSYNGNSDTDVFVDVESLLSPNKCLNEENNGTSDKSDYDLQMGYKLEESNFSLFPPPVSVFEEGESVASPLPSSQPQSLLNLNGVIQPESNADSFPCPPQHLYEPPCDNICDDLMLSESDSDDDPLELKF